MLFTPTLSVVFFPTKQREKDNSLRYALTASDLRSPAFLATIKNNHLHLNEILSVLFLEAVFRRRWLSIEHANNFLRWFRSNSFFFKPVRPEVTWHYLG